MKYISNKKNWRKKKGVVVCSDKVSSIMNKETHIIKFAWFWHTVSDVSVPSIAMVIAVNHCVFRVKNTLKYSTNPEKNMSRKLVKAWYRIISNSKQDAHRRKFPSKGSFIFGTYEFCQRISNNFQDLIGSRGNACYLKAIISKKDWIRFLLTIFEPAERIEFIALLFSALTSIKMYSL